MAGSFLPLLCERGRQKPVRQCGPHTIPMFQYFVLIQEHCDSHSIQIDLLEIACMCTYDACHGLSSNTPQILTAATLLAVALTIFGRYAECYGFTQPWQLCQGLGKTLPWWTKANISTNGKERITQLLLPFPNVPEWVSFDLALVLVVWTGGVSWHQPFS